MRKILWVILPVIGAVIGAPNAQATSFTPVFTCNLPHPEVCTSIPSAPAVSFPSTTTITVTWDTVTFLSLMLVTPDAPTDVYAWQGFETAIFGPSTFEINDLTSTKNVSVGGSLLPGGLADDVGTLTFTPVSTSTPEPNTGGLTLIGIGGGFVFVVRKRFGKGLQQVR